MARKTSKKGSGKRKQGKSAAKKPARRKSVGKAKKPVAPKPILVPTLRRPVKNRPAVARVPSPRPARHRAPPLAGGIFERDLEKNAANYAPLTPLQFLERSASVYPDRLALVHGPRRQTWAATYERCRRLASALEKVGIGLGDTVAVMAPNVPEIYEAHFGVPMAGGVLNALNIRLDAETIAFILKHGDVKVLITDTEFTPVIGPALALLDKKPLVIDIADPAGPHGADG